MVSFNSISLSLLHHLLTTLSRLLAALLKITGLTPAFMRPPFGEYNDNVRKIASEFHQSLVLWDNDSGDSVGDSMADQKAVYSNFVKGGTDKKGIFLNHEVRKLRCSPISRRILVIGD